MRRVNGLTAICIFIFLSTSAASVTSLRRDRQGPAGEGRGKLPPGGEAEGFKKRFPVVEYDAPGETDPERRKVQQERSKRYDRYGFVRRESSPEIMETVFHTHWYENIEPLPVKQSQSIVVGVVTASAAHLSNDKTGVYTEFEVEVEEVLKGGGGGLGPGKKVSADRPGGYVRYPGGHERLYRFHLMNMPFVGGEYLFFLRNPEQPQDFRVVTGYELSPQGVVALDPIPMFQKFEGMDRASFLGKVREAIGASPQ